MCTATIIPHQDGIRLGFNRDESPARPIALPPRSIACGARQVVMPIDPQSGGTWIGVNDSGLSAALLNVYESPRTPGTPMRSRGTIIPRLLSHATIDDAYNMASNLDAAEYAPFRLLLVDRHRIAMICHTQMNSTFSEPTKIAQPLLFTSSGLGDALVEPPRRVLFEEMFATYGVSQQDAYHRHSWPDRRHLSVCMERPTARTVSYALIEIDSNNIRLCYFPQGPDESATFVCMTP